MRHRRPTAADSMPKAPVTTHYYFCDQFLLLSIGSCAIAIFTVLALTISLPILYSQIETERSTIWSKAEKFKADSDRVWTLLQSSTVNELRNKRSPSAESGQSVFGTACGCSMLNCPPGPPGPAGPPGEDNPPGQPGNAGESGVDGLDIVMEPELDLPCIVCPGGPPGQRGPQGERGMPGIVGPRGEEGIPGKEGTPGPGGSVGSRGNLGSKGKTGLVGIRGDQVVAGMGVKGPKGRPGPAGQMGPNGMHGRRGMLGGQTGGMGEQGKPGQMGDAGRTGAAGDAGQPGEAGMPSSYCPADCGVSHIKVPALGKMEEAEKDGGTSNKETTDGRVLPKGRQQDGKAQQFAFDEEKNRGEIRRHPTGGYYRKQINGESN